MKKLFPNGRRGKTEYGSVFHIPLGVWLIYLLAVSMLFTGVSLAKYSSVAVGGDSAEVAKFDVQVTDLSDTSITLSSNSKSASCDLTVTNNSEVTVKYSLTVDEAALPSGVTVAVSNPAGGTLAMNGTATHTLTFTMADGTGPVESQQIPITVHAEQTD